MVSDSSPMALSVDKVRHEMLRGILIPRELVNTALQATARALSAKKTHFFAHRGVVRDVRETEDHQTQLSATDQIYSLAGLYSREREERIGPPQTAIEVDSKTGVVRIVVGSPFAAILPSPAESKVEGDTLDQLTLTYDRTSLVDGGNGGAGLKILAAPAGLEKSPTQESCQPEIADEVWRIISDEVVE